MSSRTILFWLLNLCFSVNLVRSVEDAASVTHPNVFYKCCPNSMDLNIIVNKENLITYECMTTYKKENQSNKFLYKEKYNILFDSYASIIDELVVNTNNSLNSSDEVIVSANTDYIPKCDDLKNYKIIEFNHQHHIAFLPINNYCVDLINQRIVLLYCDELSNNLIKVTKVNKCCPRNYFFDKHLRECIEMDEKQVAGGLLTNYLKNFHHLLKNDMVVFMSGPPKCGASHEYIVEYDTTSHDLTIENNNLFINNVRYDSNLSDNNYCVELIYDTHDFFDMDTKYEWIIQVCHDQTICAHMPCITKCCMVGEQMVKATYDTPNYCTAHYKSIAPVFHAMDDLDLYNSDYKPKQKDVHVFATKSGTLCVKTRLFEYFINYKDGKLLHDKELLTHHEYCTENVLFNDELQPVTFQCLVDNQPHEKYKIMAAGFSFSSVFLLLTIMVYCSLPKLCNLHGKTLLGTVISSFVAFTTLAYVQFQTNTLPSVCKYLSFVIYFSFLSSFSWLNVMCIDMYLKIRSVAPKPGTTLKSKEIRRFLIYLLFAIGYPLVMTITLILIDNYARFSDKFLPNIGISTCWFQIPNSNGNLIYFTTPIGIQIVINLVLFILTAVYCNKVKNEIARRDDNKEKVEKRMKRFMKHKDKIKLNIKLFIVMGISWILEVLSTILVEQEPIFMATDLFNTLHGLFIFIIFVCKRNILTQIKEKFGMKKRKITKSDMTMTTMISATGSSTCIDPYSTKYDKLNRSESRSPDMRSSSRLRP